MTSLATLIGMELAVAGMAVVAWLCMTDRLAPEWAAVGLLVLFAVIVGLMFWPVADSLAAGSTVYLPVIISDQPAVLNGGFEHGLEPWAQLSSQGHPLIVCDDVPTHGGRCAAFLGGDWDTLSILAQPIVVPEQSSTLGFWLKVPPRGDLCGVASLKVLVGWTHEVYRHDICQTTDWQYVTVDLSAYAGQRVALIFDLLTGHTWWSNGSIVYLDDIAFECDTCTSPDTMPRSRSITSPRWPAPGPRSVT